VCGVASGEPMIHPMCFMCFMCIVCCLCERCLGRIASCAYSIASGFIMCLIRCVSRVWCVSCVVFAIVLSGLYCELRMLHCKRYLLTSDTLSRRRDATMSPSEAATSTQCQTSTTPESRAWNLVGNGKSATPKIAKQVDLKELKPNDISMSSNVAHRRSSTVQDSAFVPSPAAAHLEDGPPHEALSDMLLAPPVSTFLDSSPFIGKERAVTD